MRPTKTETPPWVLALVATYGILTVLVGLTASRPRWIWFLGLAALPGAVTFAWFLPRVTRSQPRGIMALLYLVVCPAAAVLTAGLPAALAAWTLSEKWGGW